MNIVVMKGRLAKDPELQQFGDKNKAILTLAVERDYKRGQERTADFIPMVAWGINAVNICKYFKKGSAILITGRIQTGNYLGRDGKKKYTMDVLVEKWEFVENGKGSKSPASDVGKPDVGDFMNIADEIDEEVPFT